MKCYKTLEEKVDHVLTSVICDLEPSFYQVVKSNLLQEDFKINDLIKKAKALLLPTESRQIGRYYWLARGWSLAVAQAKIVEARKHKKPKLSPYSVAFWTTRINPDTNQPFTEKEADFKRNSLRPIRPEYWIVRGYSEQEAVDKASQAKDKNNKAGAAASKNRKTEEIRSSSPRCSEYWVARGYTEDEAARLVKDTQTTFSLDKCVERHGDGKGQEIWEARQAKWLDTLNSKPPEEIDEINRRKLSSGYTISNAEKELLSVIKEHYPDAMSQFVLRSGNRRYIFDIGIGFKLIEYNGSYWHADPRLYEKDAEVRKIAAQQVWEKDRSKIEAAKSHGYQVLVIWERDFKQDKQREIEKCMNFLKA